MTVTLPFISRDTAPRRSTSVQMGIVALADGLAVNRDLVRQVKSEADNGSFLAILEAERIQLENALAVLRRYEGQP